MNPISGTVPWSIVLAGGEGRRLQALTERWFGRHVPKQYCELPGRRTMLEDALDRAVRLSGPTRTLTVVAQQHLGFSDGMFSSGRWGHRIAQPRNCGTAPGIYLPLTYVRKGEPDAIVVILPSDHFLKPEHRFREVVHSAVRAAEELENQIVLLGAIPDSPEPDYGWIIPGKVERREGPPVFAVSEFVEKPPEALARELMTRGALCNTFVMAAPLHVLWSLGWLHAPELMRRFEALEKAIASPHEIDTLDAIYEDMPERDFASAILQEARGRIHVMRLEGVAWSDLGCPKRLERALGLAGVAEPAFAEPVGAAHKTFLPVVRPMPSRARGVIACADGVEQLALSDLADESR